MVTKVQFETAATRHPDTRYKRGQMFTSLSRSLFILVSQAGGDACLINVEVGNRQSDKVLKNNVNGFTIQEIESLAKDLRLMPVDVTITVEGETNA